MRYFHQNWYTYIRAQSKVTVQKKLDFATWWRYNMKKHENGYSYVTINPINLKIGMQCLCPRYHDCL